MKHPRQLIHTERECLEDYGAHNNYIREIAYTLQLKVKSTAGWTAMKIINEAFYQATSLLFDFSTPIFFEADYFKDSLKRMPISIASSVFSVAYILIRDQRNMETIMAMMENTLRAKPIFNSLRAIQRPKKPICLYPQTDYFSNAYYVNWRTFTNNFNPQFIQRTLDIAEDYEYQTVVAEGMLGQLRSYSLEGQCTHEQEQYITDSERLLKSYVNRERIWAIYNGDEESFHSAIGLGNIVVQQLVESDSETEKRLALTEEELKRSIAERDEMREHINKMEIEQQQKLRETEEYKKCITEMKSQLGKSHLSFKAIADCILRFPTIDLQYKAFQEVNAILAGTSWSDKASDVLAQMFSKVKQHPGVTVNIDTLHNYAGATTTINSLKGGSLPTTNQPNIIE